MLTDDDIWLLFGKPSWKRDSLYIVAIRTTRRAEISAIERAISLGILSSTPSIIEVLDKRRNQYDNCCGQTDSDGIAIDLCVSDDEWHKGYMVGGSDLEREVRATLIQRSSEGLLSPSAESNEDEANELV